jgi:hypothetical protein
MSALDRALFKEVDSVITAGYGTYSYHHARVDVK